VGLDVLAIVLALVVLMVIAFRGLPVILFAPLCALLAAGLSGRPLLPTYTETFMASAAGYIRSFFPLFLLGAVFGRLMETSGSAGTIAGVIARALGPRRSILAVVLACCVLTYGGVSLFVVAFAVYPFASALFREADIPKRHRSPQRARGGGRHVSTTPRRRAPTDSARVGRELRPEPNLVVGRGLVPRGGAETRVPLRRCHCRGPDVGTDRGAPAGKHYGVNGRCQAIMGSPPGGPLRGHDGSVAGHLQHGLGSRVR
jgi:GntP family permease